MSWRRAKTGDPNEPPDHVLGYSRGGFTSKIHIIRDGNGLPLWFSLTAGQTHESQVLKPLPEETYCSWAKSLARPASGKAAT